jgi:hypothetical protein
VIGRVHGATRGVGADRQTAPPDPEPCSPAGGRRGKRRKLQAGDSGKPQSTAKAGLGLEAEEQPPAGRRAKTREGVLPRAEQLKKRSPVCQPTLGFMCRTGNATDWESRLFLQCDSDISVGFATAVLRE